MTDRDIERVTAPKVCLGCALSSVRQCRYHAGEEPWSRPLMVDPATAIAARKAQRASYRAKNRKAWAWAVLILAGAFGTLLLGLI